MPRHSTKDKRVTFAEQVRWVWLYWCFTLQEELTTITIALFLQTQLSESEEAVEKLKQCVSSNSEALRLAEEEGNRLKTMLDRVNGCMDQFFGLKGGVEEMTERLQQGEGAAPQLVETIVTHNKWADPRIRELDEKIRDLQYDKAELERELSSVRAEEGRKTGDLARDVFAMKNRLVELERQNASLASENESIKQTAQDVQRQFREASEHISELQVLRSEIMQEKTRLETELGSADDRIAGLMKDRDSLHKKIGDLETERRNVKNEISKLKESMSEIREENGRLQNQITEHSVALKGSNAENRLLSDQLMRSRNDNEQLRDQLDAAQKTSQDSSAMLHQLQSENQELVSQRASLQSDHNRLEEKFKEVFQNLRKYQSVNPEALLAKIDYLRQMNDRLEQAVHDMSEQMRLLLKHNEELLRGKVQETEKHKNEQKYYMDMLSTVQQQKSALEGKMYDLWQEQQDKARRRNSSTSIEQLVRKAKHLFKRSSQYGDSSSLAATDSASTTSASDSIDHDLNDISIVSAVDENHADDEDGGVGNGGVPRHNSSFQMSRSMSIDLFKTSSPLKSQPANNGIHLHHTPSKGNSVSFSQQSQRPNKDSPRGNVGRWVAIERPSKSSGSDSCSNYSDSSLRNYDGYGFEHDKSYRYDYFFYFLG